MPALAKVRNANDPQHVREDPGETGLRAKNRATANEKKLDVPIIASGAAWGF